MTSRWAISDMDWVRDGSRVKQALSSWHYGNDVVAFGGTGKDIATGLDNMFDEIPNWIFVQTWSAYDLEQAFDLLVKHDKEKYCRVILDELKSANVDRKKQMHRDKIDYPRMQMKVLENALTKRSSDAFFMQHISYANENMRQTQLLSGSSGLLGLACGFGHLNAAKYLYSLDEDQIVGAKGQDFLADACRAYHERMSGEDKDERMRQQMSVISWLLNLGVEPFGRENIESQSGNRTAPLMRGLGTVKADDCALLHALLEAGAVLSENSGTLGLNIEQWAARYAEPGLLEAKRWIKMMEDKKLLQIELGVDDSHAQARSRRM